MRRLNKEYKLDICTNIGLKYGSVNRDNPQVVYVSGRCWVSPISNINNCNDIICGIEKKLRKNIKSSLIDEINFENKFILDFDINTDNMSIGTKKYLSFDFYMKQNENNKKNLKELKPLLTNKLTSIINNLAYEFNENNFIIEKRK